MSFSMTNPCWNCGLRSECRDVEHIQSGIDTAHQDTDHHKGSGAVIVMCANRVPQKQG